MRAVDTSAWIEWLSGSPLGQRLRLELPSNDEWLVPTVVQYELSRWSARVRTRRQTSILMTFANNLVVSPLDHELAMAAADYAARHALAMADAVIYATAIKYRADLLTCDAHFANLPGVIYLPKSP